MLPLPVLSRRGFFVLAAVGAPGSHGTELEEQLFWRLRGAGDRATADKAADALRGLWRDAAGPTARVELDDALVDLANRRRREAAARLAPLLREHPGFAAAWQALAELLWADGDLDGSARAAGQALAREPRQFDALYLLGLDALGQGRDEAALLAFRQVLVVYPLHAGARAQVERLTASKRPF